MALSIERVVRHRSLHALLRSILSAEIKDGFDKDWPAIVGRSGIVRGLGVRQGMPLSPLFAGLYLRDLDRRIAKRRIAVLRYVDDLVAFFDTKSAALRFHEWLRKQLEDLGLTIGEPNAAESKTKIYPPGTPAQFLGMEISQSPSGAYRLMIPTVCIDDIAARIERAGHIEYLQEKSISLTQMGSYFDALYRGYDNAYSEGQNRDDLQNAMKAAAGAAQNKILVELFGKRLPSLTAGQRRFIGLDR